MWTLDEAIVLIKDLWPYTEVHGYYIALTGSILYEGKSYHDLDLVLSCVITTTDYKPALNAVITRLNAVAEHYNFTEDYPLNLSLTLPNGKIINIFIPNIPNKKKTDNYRRNTHTY